MESLFNKCLDCVQLKDVPIHLYELYDKHHYYKKYSKVLIQLQQSYDYWKYGIQDFKIGCNLMDTYMEFYKIDKTKENGKKYFSIKHMYNVDI